MKNKLIIGLSVILIIFVVVIAIMWFNFYTSPRYTAYQLTIAAKNQDSQLALKYHDIDRIVENRIARANKDIQEEENAFIAMTELSLLSQLKETLPIQIKQNIIDEYETKSEELIKMPDYKILYYAYKNKPVSAKKLIVEKIAKNRVKQSFCNEQGKNCYIRTFEKEGNIWKVSDIEFSD
ncbi:MAG: hypothetical protein K6C94_02165 [Candidatus Gastranaerophilales bacterium]|nr:hypothetical protein [Candidatus Gastranaerophilales bacterium]